MKFISKIINFYHGWANEQGQLGDKSELATSYNNIGTIYDARDYNRALENYSKSLSIKEARR